MATAKTPLQQILEMAAQFVLDHKGEWTHADWEAFLAALPAPGLDMDDEAKRYLGNILESCKYLYCKGAAAPCAKKPASRATARSSRKA